MTVTKSLSHKVTLRFETISIMKLRILTFNTMSKITLSTVKFSTLRLGIITDNNDTEHSIMPLIMILNIMTLYTLKLSIVTFLSMTIIILKTISALCNCRKCKSHYAECRCAVFLLRQYQM